MTPATLLDQKIREDIAEETRPIRELIIAAARALEGVQRVGILPSSVLNPPNSLESPGLVYIIGHTATLPPLFEFPTF